MKWGIWCLPCKAWLLTDAEDIYSVMDATFATRAEAVADLKDFTIKATVKNYEVRKYKETAG